MAVIVRGNGVAVRRVRRKVIDLGVVREYRLPVDPVGVVALNGVNHGRGGAGMFEDHPGIDRLRG